MATADLQSIAERWIKAFNDHNIEDLLSLYHDNARHYSPRMERQCPETRGWIQGKEQLRAWWQGSFEMLPQLSYELRDITCNTIVDAKGEHSKIFMEYVRRVPDQKELYVMEYLKLLDELIIESRVLRSWPV